MRRPGKPLSSIVVVALMAGAACDVVQPTNPFDPETPPDLQATGALRGAIVLRDVEVGGEACGESDAIARITVSLRDAEGRLLRDDGLVVKRPLIDVAPLEDAPGAQGRFVIEDLAPGIYGVVFNDLPASYGAIGAINVIVTAGGDADLGTIDLEYVAGGRGPYGIDGALAVVGATSAPPQRVSLYRSTSSTALASQTGNGTFSFSGLCPGTYAVVAEADDAMPAYRLDIPVGAAQPQTSFVNDDALPLLPVGAVLLPVAAGPGAVIVDDGQAWVRDQPVPLAVLAVDGAGAGDRVGVRKMRLSTRRDFADATVVDYAPAASVLLPDEDGHHTIYAQFQATSEGGFEFSSPVFSTEVFRDTEAPTIDPAEIVVLGATRVGDRFLVTTRRTSVRARLRDETSGFAVADVGVDGPPTLAAARRGPPGEQTLTVPVDFESDGVHTVVVYARDRAGNESASAPVDVLVDSAAPDVAVEVENAQGGVLVGRAVQLRVTSNVIDDVDLLAGAAAAGGPIVPATPFVVVEGGAPFASITLPLPGDARPGGLLSFDVAVDDAVGNRALRTIEVLLPPAPTSPRLVLDGGAFYTRDHEVEAVFAAEGAVTVTLASGAFETTAGLDASGAGTARIVLPDGGDGNYAVTATFENAMGVTKTTAASIVLDTAAPALDGAVQINGGAAFANATSALLSVPARGADEMKIVVDGEVGAAVFQPYALTAPLLLPPENVPHEVCVTLRDDAGHEVPSTSSSNACATITLDTVLPSAPVLFERRPVDALPAPSLADGARPEEIEVIHLDDDVVRVDVAVDDRFGSQPAVSHARGAADVLPWRIPVALQNLPPGEANISVLFRVTAVDRAGNRSDQAALVLSYDDRRPELPMIKDADVHAVARGEAVVVYPRRDPNTAQRFPPKVNADAFIVAMTKTPSEIDVHFDHYEIATSVGFVGAAGFEVPVPLDAAFETVAGTDGLLFSLVQGAPNNGIPADKRGCTEQACLNHLFVRAVDVARNVGPVLRIDVVEDSAPPTKPSLSPRAGTVIGAEADIRVELPSDDDSDFCRDVDECERTGAACDEATARCLDTRGARLAVGRYEVKAGSGGAFGPPPDEPYKQSATGPWRLAVAREATNEICARGVDDAGNVGIEDCVVVDEGSLVLRPATGAGEKFPKIAGDYVVYLSLGDRKIRVHDLRRGQDSGDAAVVFSALPETSMDVSAHVATAAQKLVEPGEDLVAIVTDHLIDGAAAGSPTPTIAVRYGTASDVASVDSLRLLPGGSPSLSGNGLFFACGDGEAGSEVRIVRADLDLLYDADRTFTGLGAVAERDFTVTGLDDPSACPVEGPLPVTAPLSPPPKPALVTLVTLDAGRVLCPRTVVVSEHDSIAWCETDKPSSPSSPLPATTDAIRFFTVNRSGGPQPPIVDVAVSTAAQPLGRVDHGQFILRPRTIIQPFLTPTRIVWAQAASEGANAVLFQASRAGAELGARGVANVRVEPADLYDVDGERLLFAQRRPDGLVDDLFLLDLAASASAAPSPLVQLSDDLVPNPDGSIDGGRIAGSELRRLNEDVSLRRLDTDGWLESGPGLRGTPVTSGQLTAWVDLVDGAATLIAEQRLTGTQAKVAVGRDSFTSTGGTILGTSTYDVGGLRVSYARRQRVDAFDVRLADLVVFPPPGSTNANASETRLLVNKDVPLISGVVAADPALGAQSSLVFDLDVDGDAAAWIAPDATEVDTLFVAAVEVDAARTSAALSEIVRIPGVRNKAEANDTGLVPYVSVDHTPDPAAVLPDRTAYKTVVVWQSGNGRPDGGDRRTDGTGALLCVARGGAGSLSPGARDVADAVIVDDDGVALSGHAPVVAIGETTTLLAYTKVTATVDGELKRRPHVCTLDCSLAAPPTCTDDRPLAPTSEPGDSGNPAVSRRGVVAWPNGVARASTLQIDRYDYARNSRVSLTALLGDGVSRETVSIADDLLVWPDTRLGTNDVWFATLP